MPSDTPSKSANPAPSPTVAKRFRGRSALLAHAMAQRENRLITERRDARSRLNERDGERGGERGSERGSDQEHQEHSRGGQRPTERPARDPAVDDIARAMEKAGRDHASAPPRPAAPSAVAALNRPKPRHALIEEAMAARRRPAEPAGLDAMVAEALGKGAGRHQGEDGFDRQAALTDLIARTQARLGTAGPAPRAEPPAPAAEPAGVSGDRAPNPGREAAIAAAMRTHRARQEEVFEDLTLRQRATLRAAAEAMVARDGKK